MDSKIFLIKAIYIYERNAKNFSRILVINIYNFNTFL